jgi:hypothetical protein
MKIEILYIEHKQINQYRILEQIFSQFEKHEMKEPNIEHKNQKNFLKESLNHLALNDE